MAAKKENESKFEEARQEVVKLAQQDKLEQAQVAAQKYSLEYYKSGLENCGDIFANMAEVIWKFRGLIADLF